MRIKLRALYRSSGICDPGFCAAVPQKRGQHVRCERQIGNFNILNTEMSTR